MRDINDVGEIIADRELMFFPDKGESELVYVRIGKPSLCTDELDWSCPYEIVSDSYRLVFRMIGIDSLQALQLTLKSIPAEIQHWEQTRSGHFQFLNEPGAGIWTL